MNSEISISSEEYAESYQTIHSPRGANSGFVMGKAGKGGGFSLGIDRLPEQDIFIGIYKEGKCTCLPYFKNAESGAKEAFVRSGSSVHKVDVACFSADEIKRTLDLGVASWKAPGLCFEIATPVSGIPDPKTAPSVEVKSAVVPAVAARLTIDNTHGSSPLQGFFAVNGLRGISLLKDETNGEMEGLVTADGYGFAIKAGKAISTIADFDLYHLFGRPEPVAFCLAPMGGLLFEVPAGGKAAADIVFGWFKNGIVTRLHECSYYYTRYFTGIVEVLRYALDNSEKWWKEAEKAGHILDRSNLNKDRKFIIAQSIRTYYASTMLFAEGGETRWVVNEGTFMMMNTFDLTVDHLFFELRTQPWVVKNQLDKFADEYSYIDTVHFPDKPGEAYPGGISFTHDQGVYNTFSPHGYSSYEVTNVDGCFSYMSHEQLVNWILCTAMYLHTSKDKNWIQKRILTVLDCLRSMQNRDHSQPELRDGIMDMDSDRCGLSSEITTYDSLDHSLGQARRNLYLAVKCWAAYLSIEYILVNCGCGNYENETKEAQKAAVLCSKTIAGAFDKELGYVPAILDGKDKSAIIPAIEGLVFPKQLGLVEALSDKGPYGEMISVLRRHLINVLRPGLCLFPDNGWKLSANSDNSWMSKIFLCQYAAQEILDIEFGTDGDLYDYAHAQWWKKGCRDNPCIDQIHAGKVKEIGFHYPRSVTSILWLNEKQIKITEVD